MKKLKESLKYSILPLLLLLYLLIGSKVNWITLDSFYPRFVFPATLILLFETMIFLLLNIFSKMEIRVSNLTNIFGSSPFVVIFFEIY